MRAVGEILPQPYQLENGQDLRFLRLTPALSDAVHVRALPLDEPENRLQFPRGYALDLNHRFPLPFFTS